MAEGFSNGLLLIPSSVSFIIHFWQIAPVNLKQYEYCQYCILKILTIFNILNLKIWWQYLVAICTILGCINISLNPFLMTEVFQYPILYCYLAFRVTSKYIVLNCIQIPIWRRLSKTLCVTPKLGEGRRPLSRSQDFLAGGGESISCRGSKMY